jgi:tetratricopeptide (TPR) repeat protein
LKPAKSKTKTAWEEDGAKLQTRQAAWVAVVLILLVAAVFGQTARFGFVAYDDDQYVYENPVVENGLSLNGIGWAFSHTQVASWVPLTSISHMLDCQLFGINAGGHHLVNFLLHAATAVLLFLVLRDMSGTLWRSAFVAALFAIHPLRAESVAWVSERKDVLSGVFFMLTLWVYAQYVRRPSRGRYVGMTLLYGLGLLSKNTLVTLPFVLLLLDYWPLQRFKVPGFGFRVQSLVLEKIPLFLLSAGSCVTTAMVLGKMSPSNYFPLWLRVENAPVAYVTYLWQMICPAGLVIPYPYPANTVSLWQAALALVLLVAISAGVFVCRNQRPFLLMGWLWYLGVMVPMIGIVQISYYAHADRYTYLPEIGLAIAGTWAVAEWGAGWKFRRAVLGGLMAVIIAALMVCAAIQTSFWKSSDLLWSHTLAVNANNSVAHNNLAVALLQKGDVDGAIAHLHQALVIQPDYVGARNNLGKVLFQQGRLDEAVIQFQKALAIEPDYAEVHYNLGSAFYQKGFMDEAITQYQEALALQPDYAPVHNSLGNALFQKGRVEEAIIQFQKALADNPGFADAHNNLGAALLQKGRVDEAIAQCQKALALQPGHAGARNNLGAALMQAGRMAEALGEYWKVLETQPENVDALNNLAWALATGPQAALRDGVSAVALAQKAVRLSGGENPRMLRTLAAAEAEASRFAEAAETARQALQLAAGQKNDALAATLQKEIELYQMDTPLREAKP